MSKKTDTKLLELARKRHKIGLRRHKNNQELAQADMRLENGKQWTEKEEQDREGRPTITINKPVGHTKQMVGDIRLSKVSAKVRPADGAADPGTAQTLTGLLRNIEYVSNGEAAYNWGGECAVRGGFGYWRVLPGYESDRSSDQEIGIKRIFNPMSVLLDPNTNEPDRSDAEWGFFGELIDKDEFKEKYPSAALESTLIGDSDERNTWYKEDTVLVTEYYWLEPVNKTLVLLSNGEQQLLDDEKDIFEESGKRFVASAESGNLLIEKERKVKSKQLMWAKMTGTDILEGPKKQAGRYIPIIECVGEEVCVDGERITRSAIRFAHEPAKLYSWARSNALETMALGPKQPFLATPKQIEGHTAQWNTAHVTPHPFLLYNPDPKAPALPQRMGSSVPDMGAAQEAMMAADDIKAVIGRYDASLGADGGETSGKMVAERRQEGDQATITFHDNRTMAIKHTYRVILDIIPEIYDTERVVRILGEDGAEDYAIINEKIIDVDGREKLKNNVMVGKYDVQVAVGPHFQTKRNEATDGMLRYIEAFPPAAGIVGPLIAKNQDWPGAEEIFEKIEQASQQPNPEDAEQDLDMATKQATLEGKQLTNAKHMQDLADQEQQLVQVANAAVFKTLQALGVVR